MCNSPEWKNIEEQSKLNNYKGILAGHILTYIWQMSISDVNGGGSVHKAVYLIENLGREPQNKYFIDGKPFNETFIRKVWSEFKVVSHLYAAFNFLFCEERPENLPLEKDWITLSEKFRQFGVNYYPRAQRLPTLPPDDMWVPPEGFEYSDLNFEIPPLSQEELRILGNYRAPQKI